MSRRAGISGTLAALLLFTLTLIALGCIRSRDYMFNVTGFVTTEDGTPLPGAEVTIEVYGSVYAAITPVRTEHVQTNQDGIFMFMYISHQRGVKYTLTVRKQGYDPQTATGNAPPDGQHNICLKRATRSENGGLEVRAMTAQRDRYVGFPRILRVNLRCRR